MGYMYCQFTQNNKSGVKVSEMVGEKSRSLYRKKRKRNFSERRKHKEESEETAPVVDEIGSPTWTLKKLLVPPERK